MTDITSIDSLLWDRQRELTEHFRNYSTDKDILDAIHSKLAPLAVSYAFGTSLDYSFAGDRNLLVEVIRALRTSGWHSHNPKPEPDATTYYAWFNHKTAATRLWINFTSTQCKRVQIGTQLVEQPVYKVVCE
jgi:hypothetical protein